jgi:hypothetical protein
MNKRQMRALAESTDPVEKAGYKAMTAYAAKILKSRSMPTHFDVFMEGFRQGARWRKKDK